MSTTAKIVGWYLHVLFAAALVMAAMKATLIPAMGTDHFHGVFGGLCLVAALGLPAWYIIVFRDPQADRYGDELP